MTDAIDPKRTATTVLNKTVNVDGLEIFYREAGDQSSPKLVLLHGFPASSHQYRNLIPALAERFHVIAPDYPGFGNSDMPDPATFAYTFDRTSEIIESFLEKVGFTRFGLYVQDYGGPVGFRIVTRQPEWLEWLIIQNTNAYEVGFAPVWDGLRGAYWKTRAPEAEQPLEAFLQAETVKLVYTHGHADPALISPDNWNMDLHFLDRPGARQIQLDFFYDYRTNVALYPQWQKFLRERQPRDDHLLGAGRHLLHAGRRRGLSEGSAERRVAPVELGPFRRRRLSASDCRRNDPVSHKACRAAVASRGQLNG